MTTSGTQAGELFDIAIIGGGPAGSTAANDLAAMGHKVLLLDRDGRIKPCGGAVPPQLLREFAIPDSLLEARVSSARMISPSDKAVDMTIGGFVGMVDRETFDEWLRQRAEASGAERRIGKFVGVDRDRDGVLHIRYKAGKDGAKQETVRSRLIIGADGAASRVRQQMLPKAKEFRHVYAYHEIVESPDGPTDKFDPLRCDVYYQGTISPDFYGWVFPHGKRTSIGMGTAVKGFSLRSAVKEMRDNTGLADNRVVRREGAPLPLQPLRRWDNGRDAIVIGDAAGAVAPSSGEGIYYAMSTGRHAANAASEYLATGRASALKKARRQFMKEHGMVFFILGIMQRFWYVSDKRREKFVDICRDPDVQRLTWEAYMNKKLVRAKPGAHVRIFFKDLAHLVGLNPR
jgi:geranylgeranyl reductase